jgi:hypothetical protein
VGCGVGVGGTGVGVGGSGVGVVFTGATAGVGWLAGTAALLATGCVTTEADTGALVAGAFATTGTGVVAPAWEVLFGPVAVAVTGDAAGLVAA